jgi:hypothetical protein
MGLTAQPDRRRRTAAVDVVDADASSTRLDFSRYEPDEPIRYVKNASAPSMLACSWYSRHLSSASRTQPRSRMASGPQRLHNRLHQPNIGHRRYRIKKSWVICADWFDEYGGYSPQSGNGSRGLAHRPENRRPAPLRPLVT